jgi:hypothetical protein
MRYIFTMAYYSPIKENNISFAITFGKFLLVYLGSKDHILGPPIFFAQNWPWTTILLTCASCIPGIMGVSHHSQSSPHKN